MTPEKAHKLRERATPGPWERHPDNPRMLCNLDRKFAVHAELVKNRGLEPDPEDVANTELIAAAPDLAELVAGLRYEYAVQVNGREWLRENDEGRFVLTGDPMRALRHYHPGVAASIAKGASAQFSCECRVVRRLVGEPEVSA